MVSRRSQSGRKVEASGWSPPLRTMAVFVCSVQMPVVRRGAQLDLLCWTVAQCLTHRAQGASDGRRARRLAESRPEPARASLLVRRNSWSQLVATSRHAARRDEHPRGLRPARRLRCCGGTAEQVRAAVAGPWLGHRPTPRTLANRCSSRRRGAFKYEKQQRLNRSEIRFARDGRQTENCT